MLMQLKYRHSFRDSFRDPPFPVTFSTDSASAQKISLANRGPSTINFGFLHYCNQIVLPNLSKLLLLITDMPEKWIEKLYGNPNSLQNRDRMISMMLL